jgi:hypothetical protein
MDYGNIYKIISYSTDKIYIGSTVKKIEERLEEHEECYALWLSSEFQSGYCTSFEIIKYGDYKIKRIYLMRQPLHKIINFMLNIITLYQYNKLINQSKEKNCMI